MWEMCKKACMGLMGVFGGAAIGLLLLVIGNGIDNKGTMLAGMFILPLSFLWGGMFRSENSTAQKITLLAIGGVLMVLSVESLFTTGSINLGSLLGAMGH
jgi:hypothetical protein